MAVTTAAAAASPPTTGEQQKEELTGLPSNYPTSVDQLPGRRRDHPLYRTSAQEYGRDASVTEKQKWSGRRGDFTKDFLGGPPRDCGLNVAMDKSRVIRDPGALGPAPQPLI
eukprot:TRINITY_DN10790_c0_g1_i1.p2 TRINITY_DN10790_c0_g1~~TRINITY_DN10790_c0_g1_i1.p2  ORF type:complete len:112 (+),score=33.26 TRINITY_DN10790_c0_g1_i1:77-412(+)